MRKGIEVRLARATRGRLEAVMGSGNSPQKIVLLNGDGVGTRAIQAADRQRQANDLALARFVTDYARSSAPANPAQFSPPASPRAQADMWSRGFVGGMLALDL